MPFLASRGHPLEFLALWPLLLSSEHITLTSASAVPSGL